MSLNYQQLQSQVRSLGKRAVVREKELNEKRSQARDYLQDHAQHYDRLRSKVERAADIDPTLRCARPANEALTARVPAPPLPQRLRILAADGSQINPDPHAAVQYYLINIGGIWLDLHRDHPPQTMIETRLRFEDDVYTPFGMVSRGQVALQRDVAERAYLSTWAEEMEGDFDYPLITLTDGPLELWESHEQRGSRSAAFRKQIKRYQESLRDLRRLGSIPAGYVDRPRADYVVRLLEIAALPEDEMGDLANHRPLLGVSDLDLYGKILEPGERSAVFGIQAYSSTDYSGDFALHFFYLNVGSPGSPWLARVEVPAWVVEEKAKLGDLHAVLLQQCRVLGDIGYPYLLHRAHEIALVRREEQALLTEMILRERRKRGLQVSQVSHKKYYKEQPGRKRYRR